MGENEKTQKGSKGTAPRIAVLRMGVTRRPRSQGMSDFGHLRTLCSKIRWD